MIVSMNQLKPLPWDYHEDVLIINKLISIAQVSSYFKCLDMHTVGCSSSYAMPTFITEQLHLVTQVQQFLINVTLN